MNNQSILSIQEKLNNQRKIISNKCTISTERFAARVLEITDTQLKVLPYDSEGEELSETWISRSAVSHVIGYKNEYKSLYM